SHQHQHRDQIYPVTDHVHVGEDHVPGAAHQRDEVVAKAPEKQRGQQVDHHDHAVHGDELVVVVGRDEGESMREAQLQAHQHRHDEGNQADTNGGDCVLDRDDLVVLTPDVFCDEGLRIMQCMVAVCDCYVCH